MSSLFVRLFASIWLASALIGAGVAVTEALQPSVADRHGELLHLGLRVETRALVAQLADEVDEHELAAQLGSYRERTGASLYLFDRDGRLRPGQDAPDAVRRVAARVSHEGELAVERQSGTLVGIPLEGGGVAVARVLQRPRWARALGTDDLPLRIALVLGVSGLVAFVLARHLSAPIEHLRRATHAIARGELSARAAPLTRGAHTELRSLAQDFDRMAARIEALVTSRQQLLADVSHELNSPLARLRVGLALARNRLGPEQSPILDQLERDTERMGALVEEIVTLSRLESMPRPHERLDLLAVLDEVVADVEFEARAAEVRVARAPSTSISILGDRESMRRALENVLRNAVRYAPPGSVIEIAIAEEHDGSRSLTIRDHGPGVPDEHLRSIFEPMFRVDLERDRSRGGSGLGLAIASRAVDLHGGAIEASNAVDGGLIVTIRLPAKMSLHNLTKA
ncbi:MAG: ATP-binding protein [Myxococcota bacterium]|nr:ATP-binding protein [Myxococcota bacterium]